MRDVLYELLKISVLDYVSDKSLLPVGEVFFFKVSFDEWVKVPGMDPLAYVFCLQEAHPYLLQFTRAPAIRVVWDSGHQSSQQAQQQPAAGIKERSYRWKQQNVKMLDCRPALGGGRDVGAWNAPKVSRPVEKGC